MALSALLALVESCSSRAQASAPVTLEWNAPAGCSGSRDVLERVRKLTNSSEFGDKQLQAEATIARGDRGRLHLKLVLHAGNLVGERDLVGRTCEDLAGATAVVLALLLRSPEPLRGGDLEGSDARRAGDGNVEESDASSTGGAGQPPPAALASPAPAPASLGEVGKPASEPAAGNSKDARLPRRWHGVVQVPLLSMGLGPLPRPSIGSLLGAGVVFERWSFLAEGGAWRRQTIRAHDQADAGASVRRIEGAARSCRAIPFGRFQVAPCLRVSLQHIWTLGTGVHVASRTAEATWLAAAVGVQARYQIVHWLRVFGGIDAHVETSRPRISIDGVGSLGQLWPVALTITVGSEWIL